MTVNTPLRRNNNVGAFDRVANVSFKEPSVDASVRSNIRVVVRVRPENEQELSGGHSTVVRVLDERLLIFDPKEDEAPDFYHGRQRQGRDFSKRKHRDMRFAFDYVFDTDATNEDLYNNTTKGILDSLLNGFNCSVFAYGATGAGKTHSMKGTPHSPGVMFLTMMDLYQRMELIKEEKTCDVAVSYLEVYNEQIRDLLNPTTYLPVREDPSKGTIVAGLSLHKPRTAEELLHMLDFGNKNRTQHPTDANAESSRSHAVFQVFVRQKERTANVTAEVSIAKMSLIDLAGSERATMTKNMGVRFREGANINRSLLALGNCINALAEGKTTGYVPYRNSKLTRLLKDSLGGNCRTVMIAAISPSGKTYEDTYNTLKYADRAKNIKANLKRNVVSVDYHISHYVKMIEDLRTEVDEYKVKVKRYEEGAVIDRKTTFDSPYQCEIERLQGVLFSVFHDRMNIRKEMMELEGSERDLQFRVHLKEKALERIGLVYSDPAITEKAVSKIQRSIYSSKKHQVNMVHLKAEGQTWIGSNVVSKIQRSIYSSKKRQVNMVHRKAEGQTRIDSNVTELQRVENEMQLAATDGVTPEILELTLRTRHLEVELRDTKRHVKYLKKLCRAQQREALATERLIKSLLEGFKKQYLLLKADSLATADIDADYNAIKQMVFGEREVVWADQSMHETRLGSGDGGGLGDSTGRKASDSEFDINPLLEFPVMACVNTTPKTPANKTNPQTPGSAMSVAMTPCTPGSYRKGRFTPRRQSMPVFQMTPSTPRLCGSHQLINTTMSSATKSYLTPNKTVNASRGTATNLLNAIDENCEIITGSATVTLNPCTSYLVNHNSAAKQLVLHEANRNNNSHTQPTESSVFGAKDYNQHSTASNSCGKNNANLFAPNTPRHHSCSSSTDNRMLNETFTKLDGVEPLQDSPPGGNVAPCLQNSSSKVQSVNSNINSNSNTHSTGNNHRNPCNETGQNSQKTLSNSSTITKSRPDVLQTTNNSNRMLNVTVTKSKPTVITDKENVTPPQEKRMSVVRSMTFENMPSPAGKLTFAEALKSPAVRKLQEAGVAPFSPRSPLCSKENLPTYRQEAINVHQSVKNGNKKIPRLSLSSNQDKTISELRRLGLPSVRERAHSASRVPGNKQVVKGYMRATSAANRRNIYRNPNEEMRPQLGSAKRVKIDENRKIPRNIGGVRRSQSMNHGAAQKWSNRF